MDTSAAETSSGTTQPPVVTGQSKPAAAAGAKKGARVTRVTKKKGELLTEEEKKANHIASEQKRRQNIRTGYDQLIQIVPTLTPSQRSEALILQKTVEYIKYLLMEREILEGQVKDVGR
ncbi:Transcription factor [Coemansia sp. RSA 1722]|nr:Transcription factor [Coemansia sp. RSA 486]KAJ2232184.1 Transcription factor [Coemansia sp. RSA 485]KAJ2600821.1 Transcription factor [Coemansia sp. RSA 1721]KAJ2600980.1 Transcription factor [Coemansia sp. RSA 1722]